MKITIYATVYVLMGNTQFGSILIMAGLVLLIASCSAVNQLDHDNPVKPLAKPISMEMVKRIRNSNKVWYPVELIAKN